MSLLTLLDGFMIALRKSARPRVGDCWASAISYYYDKEGLAQLRRTTTGIRRPFSFRA